MHSVGSEMVKSEPPEADSSDTVDLSSSVFEVDPAVFALPAPHPAAKVELTQVGSPPKVGDRLNQPIEKLSLPTCTLGELCRFVEQMSGIMVSMEPGSLAMARAGPDKALTLDAVDTILGTAFRQGLRSLFLGYRTEGAHVVVQHLSVLHGHPPELAMGIGDLLNHGWRDHQLLQTIQETIEPQLWATRTAQTLAVQDDELVIREPPWIQFQILELIEKLRLESGLATRSAYGPVIASQPSCSDCGKEVLSRQVFVHGRQGITVREWLRELELQATGHFLPAWPDLERQRVAASARLRFTVDAMPLGDHLAAILSPLGLTSQPLRHDTFWITTATQERRTYITEVYSLQGIKNRTVSGARQILAGIQAGFISSLGQDGIDFDPAQSRFALDASGSALIARLPRSQQRRLAIGLSRLLAKDGALAAIDRTKMVSREQRTAVQIP
jgi:hypothetical protein